MYCLQPCTLILSAFCKILPCRKVTEFIHFVWDCPAPFSYLNKTVQKEVIDLILFDIVQDTTMAHADNTVCPLQASCKGVHLDYLLPCSRIDS